MFARHIWFCVGFPVSVSLAVQAVQPPHPPALLPLPPSSVHVCVYTHVYVYIHVYI